MKLRGGWGVVLAAAVFFPSSAGASSSAEWVSSTGAEAISSSSVAGSSSSGVDTRASSQSSSNARGSSSSVEAPASELASSSEVSSSGTASSAARPSSSRVCVPGCVGHTLRFCSNGNTLNRDCASDEVCAGDACVLATPADAGEAPCVPGCVGQNSVRRCVHGVPAVVACETGWVCVSAACAPDDAGPPNQPDAGCLNSCEDDFTLVACVAGGGTLRVTCNGDSPCKDGACTPPPSPPPPSGGHCGCTGASSLTGAFVLLLALRPRRQPF